MVASEPILFDTAPTEYRHWRLEIEPPIATLTMQVTPDAGLRDDYELKLNSYDLAVDIELYDVVQRLRFEHPEVHGRRRHGRPRQGVLRRRQHPDARRLLARPQGQLLQVHQRDAQRHRGRDGALRPDLDRRGQRHGRRRRLRARPRVRRDRARRRPGLGRVAPGGAAAGGAARHRRPDPVGRQAPRAPRPRRRLRRPRTEGVKGQQALDWGLVDAIAPTQPVRRRRAGAGPGSGPLVRTAPPPSTGSR